MLNFQRTLVFRIEFTWVALLAIVFVSGCKTTPIYRETRIIDTVLYAQPPPIHDTLVAVDYDTVIVAERIHGRDTVIRVKYFPRTNTVTLYAKPDTVRIPYRDTTTIFRESQGEDNTTSWSWLWILIAIILSVALGYLLRKKQSA